MRDLFFLTIFFVFMVVGAGAPFIFVLGYVWVDYFTPQAIAYSFLRSIPISQIIAIAAFVGFLWAPKRESMRPVGAFWLLLAFAVWITITTIFADVGYRAWEKWDWAVKTVCFAAFMPFLIKSRTHIEAVLLVIVLSIFANTLPFGTKVVLSGGGYGRFLGLIEGNSLLGESGTLSTVAVASIPLLVYFYKHNRFFPPGIVTNGIIFTAIADAILTALGTQERSALVVLGVLALLMWWGSKKKIGAILAFGLVAFVAAQFVDASWHERMQTIANFQQDSSAMRRIGVWLWTLDYVASNPLGGGFLVYLKDTFTIVVEGQRQVYTGIAFHSIFLEILGEQGVPGAILFGSIIATFFVYMRRVRTAALKKTEELQWAADLARSLQMSMILYLCGGVFQGIAYQPTFYYLFSIGIAMHELAYRATMPNRAARFVPQLARGNLPQSTSP